MVSAKKPMSISTPSPLCTFASPLRSKQTGQIARPELRQMVFGTPDLGGKCWFLDTVRTGNIEFEASRPATMN